MGTDSFAKFTRWYQWQTILTLANILILHRPGDAMAFEGEEDRLWHARRVERFDKESGQLSELAVTQLDISSTQIRNLLKNGESADFLVPESVAAHIKKHQLYHTN
jgi:nicotinate-nucleotide adenylyltransferase